MSNPVRRVLIALSLAVAVAGPAAAESVDGWWAIGRYACDGEGLGRSEAALLVHGYSLRWYTSVCTVVSSYKVGEAYFQRARCESEGRTSEIPVMLEPRGDRLRVGWNREPMRELHRCRWPRSSRQPATR